MSTTALPNAATEMAGRRRAAQQVIATDSTGARPDHRLRPWKAVSTVLVAKQLGDRQSDTCFGMHSSPGTSIDAAKAHICGRSQHESGA
eukprot:7386110-Prymnesium_polylepis.2